MPEVKKLDELVINEVENIEVFNYMKNNGLVNEDEMYLVKNDGSGPLVGNTEEITPAQVYEATKAGREVIVSHTDSVYGVLTYSSFGLSDMANVVIANVITQTNNNAWLLGELIGNISLGSWQFFPVVLAKSSDIPTKLPSPNALTIVVGDTSVTYDGTEAMTITIPDGSDISY